MDENIKEEVLKMIASMKSMSVPCISVTPMFDIDDAGWKRLLYIFLEIRSQIEPKIESPLIITVCDLFDRKHWKEDIDKLRESKP